MSHHLYRHFDADGKLLYVGISLHAVIRLAQHREKASWFDQIRKVEITTFGTIDAAAEAERTAIQAEHPAHNVQLADRGNPRQAPSERIYRRLANWLRRQPDLFSISALRQILGLPDTVLLADMDSLRLPWMPLNGERNVSAYWLASYIEHEYSGDSPKWSLLTVACAHCKNPVLPTT